MKQRLPYIISAGILFLAELYIGFFVHDAFVRPYGGDILITILLCCLWRCVFPNQCRWMPLGIFGFSVAVEFFQLLVGPYLKGTVIGIIVGASFSWIDILCYGIGCLLFAATEHFFRD